MKTINYLICFFVCCILIDSCSNHNESTKAGLRGTSSDSTLTNLENLCDTSEKAYVIPVLKLPSFQTFHNISRDSLIVILQQKADELSWRTFIAMNWLATNNGNPDSTQCFGSRDGIAVWENWMPQSKLFRTDNQSPKLWQNGLIKSNTGGNASLIQYTKNSGLNPEFRNTKIPIFNSNELKVTGLSDLDADGQPVPNQSYNNTLYEVMYNRQTYDYIVGGKLYNIDGQRSFTQKWPRLPNGLKMVQGRDTLSPEKIYRRVYMPMGGSRDTSFVYDTTKKPNIKIYLSINLGAIMVKAAWSVLTSKDDPLKYHTRKVQLKQGAPLTTLGLVGLHIAHKVSEAPRWVWSTFEHINNAPPIDEHGKAAVDPNINYMYFNKFNKDTSLYNKPPGRLSKPDPKALKSRQRVQVVVLQKRTKATDLINATFHELIRQANKESVWLNYRLVGTQWPFVIPTDPFQEGGKSVPALMANALLETYHQSTSSCMGCHQQARILKDAKDTSNTTGYFADFVWGLALGNTKNYKK